MTAEISLRGSRGWPRYTTPSGVFGASPERSFRVAPARYASAACSVNHWLAVPAVEAASSCRGGTGDEMHKSRGQLERRARPAGWLAVGGAAAAPRGVRWGQCARSDTCRRSARDCLSSRARPRTWSRLVALLGLGDLDCAEAFEWAVDEEDLHCDVGLDVGLAEEGQDLAPGQLFDRLLVARFHNALEVLAHGDHAVGLAAVHDRLLQRGEAAAAHHDDDDVIERVGLGLHRTAPVVIAQDADA